MKQEARSQKKERSRKPEAGSRNKTDLFASCFLLLASAFTASGFCS
jgi:hypothetical protein